MIKFLLPLISFFLGNAKNLFKEPSIALTQQLVMHIRSIILLAVTCIGSLTLFCVGASLLISRLAVQVDSSEGFYFSVGMWIYSGLTLVSILVLIYSLRRETWLKAMGLNQTPQQKQQGSRGGALENAVALLVMDFIEERQNRRDQKRSSESAS